MQFLRKNSLTSFKKIFFAVVLGILFFSAIAAPASASIDFSGFSFEDTFTVNGKTFYADIVQEGAVEYVDGTYDLRAAFGFYGNDADMELYDADIDNGIQIVYKKQGTTQILGELGVDASISHVSSPNYPDGHASTYEMSSAREGNYADPGLYIIDAYYGATFLTSINVCLPTFTSPSGQSIGNQICGNNNGGGDNEITQGQVTVSNITASTANVQVTGFAANTQYQMELINFNDLLGCCEDQTITTNGSGAITFGLNALSEDTSYRVKINDVTGANTFTFTNFSTLSHHLTYTNLTSNGVTVTATDLEPGAPYEFLLDTFNNPGTNEQVQNVTAGAGETASASFSGLNPGVIYNVFIHNIGGITLSSHITFTTPAQGGEPDTTGGEDDDGEPDTTPTGGDGDGSGGENNDGEEENLGNDNNQSFGDGVSLLAPNSEIINVPMISWNDQLAFRLRTQANDVTIFGFSLEDLQNGNFNPANFSLENLSNFDFNFIDALNLQNLLSGNIEIGDTNISGIEIQGVQFVYDFFYDISANINFNGRSYSKVTAYFGRYPEQLTKKVAEYTNVSGSLLIEGKVYNSNNNNENEVVKDPLFVGRSYYLGIYGEYDDNGTLRSETIAIKRLPEYVARPVDANRISVFWSAPPYMSITGNSVKFSLAGTIDSRNMVRDATVLKFGEGSYTFKNIGLYPASMGPDISFARTLENVYTNADTFTTLPLLPGKMYYAGIYEGEELVSFIQVGRTPQFLVSQDPETTPTGDGEDGEEDSLFNQDPFADLAQDLESGIVPCDGLNVECDYNKAIELIERGINFLFIMIIPIAAIAFAYAGFLLLFQGSSPEKRKQARDIFIKVFIGIVIVLAAWLIIKTILVSLGVDQENIWLDLSNTQ